jgi:hypothetical protein
MACVRCSGNCVLSFLCEGSTEIRNHDGGICLSHLIIITITAVAILCNLRMAFVAADVAAAK